MWGLLRTQPGRERESPQGRGREALWATVHGHAGQGRAQQIAEGQGSPLLRVPLVQGAAFTDVTSSDSCTDRGAPEPPFRDEEAGR